MIVLPMVVDKDSDKKFTGAAGQNTSRRLDNSRAEINLKFVEAVLSLAERQVKVSHSQMKLIYVT
ncbi:MAG: hypothetical protein OEX07_14020 [Gammaproteobacteria bacterium]|nr:hypothetical protein [Gammaproteobacteria bacterium]